LFFAATSWTGSLNNLEIDKCQKWEWFDWDRLPSPLFKPFEIFIDQNPNLSSLLHEGSLEGENSFLSYKKLK